MENELSIVRLVVNASPVVQVVMGLLLLASLMSWTIIFRKRSLISRAREEAESFENSFWKGGDLTALYRQIESRGNSTGMSSIFEFGFREFARLKQGGIPADQLLEGARRAMRVGQLKEIERLEESLSNLATVGSTASPSWVSATVEKPAVTAIASPAPTWTRCAVTSSSPARRLSGLNVNRRRVAVDRDVPRRYPSKPTESRFAPGMS